MKKTFCRSIRSGLLCLSLFCYQHAGAQQNKEDALEKGKRALKLMDEEHKYDEAIRLLKESASLDPGTIEYPYEIAYAYYAQQQFDKAVAQLLTLKERADAHARVFQLLGNSYDMIKQGSKAMSVYEEGLKKFPASGELHLELGNMMAQAKNYDRALEYYEKGIKADPGFPSNYYWAAKIYCSSEEEVWGMLYGEIFMNLERNSKRTGEISKMLFNVYRKEITFTSETQMSVSFSKNMVMLDDKKDIKKMKLPFGAVYETTLLLATLPEKSIDLNSLDRIRQAFTKQYFSKGQDKDYPNVLFDYQMKIQKAGHFEAYNHWLLSEGDSGAFTKWSNANKGKWDAFVTWFSENRLVLDKNHYFVRSQY